MILRSPLRMNKNIVFPFISCVMIMLTLLVLIRKSADELNAAKKEISLCKQQHDSVYSQLQNAIEYKLRLEKSLENEKTDEKQKVEEIQRLLNQEKEERQKEKEELRKEKEEANNRYDTLKQQFDNVQNDNNELKSDNEETRKKLHEVEDENRKLTAQLQQLETSNNKVIEDLREKLKIQENHPPVVKKATSEVNPAPLVPAEGVELVQGSSKGSTTPQINQDAIKGFEDSPKQVAPPPNNGDSENMMKKMMLGELNGGKLKPDENVIKSPLAKPDEEHDKLANAILVNEEGKKANGYQIENIGNKNQPNMNLPIPYNLGMNRKASSASNNAAERVNRPDDQAGVLPPPAQPAPSDENKEKGKDMLPKKIKDYMGEDYGKDGAEDDGVEDDYDKDVNVKPPEQKAG